MTTIWLEQRERGSLPAMRLISWIVRRLGHPTGRMLLAPICWYFVAFAPGARRSSMAYLASVLQSPVGIGNVYRHFHTFASTLLDRVIMLSGGSARFDLQLHGWPGLEAILARGRGCILLGSHLGSFEILRAFGERHQKLAINVIMHEGNSRAISSWSRQMAPELAGRIIPPGAPDTLLRVRECLERGEIVAMLGDRPFANERTAQSEFLGRPARFPTGPLLVAALLGSPVVSFFCLYRKSLQYDVHFDVLSDRIEFDGGPRERMLACWIDRYVRILEGRARAAPYNWFNFYDFWKDA